VPVERELARRREHERGLVECAGGPCVDRHVAHDARPDRGAAAPELERESECLHAVFGDCGARGTLEYLLPVSSR